LRNPWEAIVIVTRFELFFLAPRWVFLKIETDEGISGWGEPVLEGRAHTVAAAVDELMLDVVGKNPFEIERLWQRMKKGSFYRGGAIMDSALAGIDQALWDIKGKALGVPVYQLLGGQVRDRVRIYGHIGAAGSEDGHTHAPVSTDIKELLASADAQMARGLTALKFCPADGLEHIDTPEELKNIVARVTAVREHVGDAIDIALDFHGRFSLAMARRVFPYLEPLNLLFIEEPVLPEFTDQFELIVSSTSTPIATGERLFDRKDFKDVLRSGIAVAQPDLSHAGGISECRRIASMAEVYDVSMAPHCPLGPIALAACLQLDFATPNFLIQEQVIGLGRADAGSRLDIYDSALKYLVDLSVFDAPNGYIELMTRPGLGIEIDEAEVRKASESAHRWRAPFWTHKDGSHAEW
jgi:galactonate dehydratase